MGLAELAVEMASGLARAVRGGSVGRRVEVDAVAVAPANTRWSRPGKPGEILGECKSSPSFRGGSAWPLGGLSQSAVLFCHQAVKAATALIQL